MAPTPPQDHSAESLTVQQPSRISVRLVRRGSHASAEGSPSFAAAYALDAFSSSASAHELINSPESRRGAVFVEGGPGCGRTTFLESLAIQEIHSGTDIDSIAILTHSKQAASRINAHLMEFLSDSEGSPASAIFMEPFARSVHSFAFAILRAHAVRNSRPAPRLLTGAEHDSAVRDLLQGHVQLLAESLGTSADPLANSTDSEIQRGGGSTNSQSSSSGESSAASVDRAEARARGVDEGTQLPVQWPLNFHAALGAVGFARQLRDLLLRAAERGIGPAELVELGNQYNRPEWAAAGQFSAEFNEVMALRGEQSLNASELVAAAVSALRQDPALVESMGIKVLLVDDVQFLDPKSAELIEVLSQSSRMTVMTADAHQSVFRFRGASVELVEELKRNLPGPHTQVILPGSHRVSPEIAHVVENIMGPWPGTQPEESTQHSKQPGESTVSHKQVSASRNANGSAPHTWGNTAGFGLYIASTPTGEIAAVVDRVRRAHLADSIPWKDIAVIVRSSSVGQSIKRGLLSAGVPVAEDPTDVVLAEQPMVQALLRIVRYASEGTISDDKLESLILSPLVRGDSITLRRLYRGIRKAFMSLEVHDPSAAEEIVAQCQHFGQPKDGRGDHPETDQSDHRAITFRSVDAIKCIVFGHPLPDLEEALVGREHELLKAIQKVMCAALDSLRNKDSIEMVLWKVWSMADLANSLEEQSLRGGARGSIADRHLDSMMALFDAAGDYVERHPHATVQTFVDFIDEQQLPTGLRDRRGPQRDAVVVIPAHTAVGREWDTVIVSGLQEGVWPSLGLSSTIFKQEELVDLLDRDVAPGFEGARLGALSDKLAEERRLFTVALTRARRSVLVTATGPVEPEGGEEAEGDERSRFLAELGVTPTELAPDGELPTLARETPHSEAEEEPGQWAEWGIPRVLSADSLIAELRRVVCDSTAATHQRVQAARQLARLTLHSRSHPRTPLAVADPQKWWSSLPLSTTEPLYEEGETVPLHASGIEAAMECALGAVMNQVQGGSESTSAMALGQLVHGCAQALAEGAESEQIQPIYLAALNKLIDVPQWAKESTIAEWLEAYDSLVAYLESRRGSGMKLVGVEVKVTEEIGHISHGRPVVVRGRIDRLEKDNQGNYFVIDFKTSKTPSTKEGAEANPQLRTYQLVLRTTQPPSPSISEAAANPDGQSDRPTGLSSQVSSGDSAGLSPESQQSSNQGNCAELVYPRVKSKGSARAVPQSHLNDNELYSWRHNLLMTAESIANSEFTTNPESSLCTNCAFYSLCPAQGGHVTTLTYGGQ